VQGAPLPASHLTGGPTAATTTRPDPTRAVMVAWWRGVRDVPVIECVAVPENGDRG